MIRLYPAGLATASTRVKYSGLDATAQRQQPCCTENWSFSVNTETSGDNIDEIQIRDDDWSTDFSKTVSRCDDNARIQSTCCNVSASVTARQTDHLVVQRLGVGLVIERSLARLPAGVLSSQLGQLSLPSLRGR